MKKTVQVGLIQMTASHDKQQNITKAEEKIIEAAKKGAQIICLQELFTTVYFCDTENYDNFVFADTPPNSDWMKNFQAIAQKYSIVIIAPYFEKRTHGLYHNSALVFDADGSILGNYRKNHIPDDPGFYEKFYFTPGDTGYQVFKTKYATIGVLICWDQWYPEAARITSLMGAEILFYPTAIGWAMTQDEQTNKEQFNAWQTAQKAHSVANGVFVVSVNRVGIENGLKFWGGSFVCNPFSTPLFQASHENEEIEVCELDLSKIDYYRTHWPFYRDRRIDTYNPILKRYID